MQLRPFQINAVSDIRSAWGQGSQNVLGVYPCASGKTVIASDIIKKHSGPTCAIAHRRELVTQMALTLARYKIKHRIIGPKSLVKSIVNHQMLELGDSYYDSNAQVGVSSVSTMVRRSAEFKRWFKSVTLWVTDESHHLLRDNVWGEAIKSLPNAKGLGLTATPLRADGRGLGRHADGLIDVMVEGPTSRELINAGYLTDYRIFNPSPDFDRTNIPTGKDGDFTLVGAAKAVRNSPIIGDIVKHYLDIAPGKLGVTFVPSVDIAIDTAAKFNANGVPAVALHAKTPLIERIVAQQKFKNREILQLVNVDLFGEGYDLPAIEVIQQARPTKSYALYHQQFMRALRLMIPEYLSDTWGNYTNAQRLQFISKSVKPFAIIIDHVNNIDTTYGGHGLPDAPRIWSLDRRDKRSKKQNDDVIPTRTCIECTGVYERFYKKCIFCGYMPIPSSRSSPEFVDGDLTELDATTLAMMRGEIDRVNMTPEDYKAEQNSKYVAGWKSDIHIKHHIKRQEIHKALGSSIAWWAGYQRSYGRSDDESYRRFYITFGIDVLSAQALKTREALALAEKINNKLGELAQ